MNSPIHEGDGTPAGHLLSLKKVYSIGTGLDLIKLPWKSSNNSYFHKENWLLSTNWQQCPIAEENTQNILEHGEVKLVPTKAFTPMF